MKFGIDVLLIEDYLPDAYYLQELLVGDPEYPVLLKNADSLAKAMDMLGSEHFDLVLSDLGLPDSHGLETAFALRREFPAIPIIVLTGFADEELAMQSLQMDIQDYLVKGQIGRDQLIRSIRYALERKRVLETLRQREEWYRTLFDSMDEAYCVIEMRIEPGRPLDFRFIETNQAFERHTGLTEVEGMWMRELRPDREISWFEPFREVALTGNSIRFEYCAEQLQGRWFSVNAFRVGLPELKRVAVLFTDITQQKRLLEEVKSMAYHDALTGLPNRRLFRDIMNLGVAEARRHQSKLALVFMDLDRFKEINDTLGHEAGDELLVEVARRLKASVRESDTVARIGGDEFNLLLADIQQPDDITGVIHKIRAAFLDNFAIAGKSFRMSTSIGVSIYPDDSEEIEALLRFADNAMYHVKEMGRNGFQFYNPRIHEHSLERQRLEGALRRSIELGELAVHYQPQIDIRTGRTVCAEALVRWNDPEMGLLDSARFLDLAEETGFIAIIDEWVVRTVCTQIRRWLDIGMTPLCFTVNLSARQFQSPDFVARIAAIIREFEIPSHVLTIELKEGVVMGNIEHAVHQLGELVRLGMHVSVDDFGSGYSSLRSLKRLPFDKLKIARSFIRDIAEDPDTRTIITAIVSMAHKMSLKVIAVGVETEAQLAFLRRTRCDQAQGYFLGRPLPARDFTAKIAAGRGL